MSERVDHEVLAELRGFDTPTLCNALEGVANARRAAEGRPVIAFDRYGS